MGERRELTTVCCWVIAVSARGTCSAWPVPSATVFQSIVTRLLTSTIRRQVFLCERRRRRWWWWSPWILVPTNLWRRRPVTQSSSMRKNSHTHGRRQDFFGRENVVKCCQYYFGFDLPSTIWLKRVQKFEAKFKECDNLFCKLTVCKTWITIRKQLTNYEISIICLVDSEKLCW